MPGIPDKSRAGIPLEWSMTTGEAVRRWPVSEALACVALPRCTGHPRTDRRAVGGWTIVTSPALEGAFTPASGDDALAALDSIGGWTARAGEGAPPFVGGWIGVLDYELGSLIEPAVGGRRGGRGPAVTWLECPGAYLHDAETNQWFGVGDFRHLPDLSVLRREPGVGMWRAGALRSVQGREHYEGAVARVVELTRAGDIFQSNIAHQMRAGFEGSSRGLFARLLESARPLHGAYVELPECADMPGHIVCSMSPELFLDADFGSGVVRSRPIKGTRPVALAHDLLNSDKDKAELVMIVDLMRNDLGRVCRPGSVRVERARTIERHGPIVHGVASVAGVMREGTTVGGLLRAAFPAGSVTGAPKVRAMQVIKELEGFRRGVYCGSVGVVSRCGRSTWNVAIRTATITGDELVYPVGAGIVEGSVPSLEWEETLHKAEAFSRVLGESAPERARVVAGGAVSAFGAAGA